jgi:hypothetical protein
MEENMRIVKIPFKSLVLLSKRRVRRDSPDPFFLGYTG